MMVLGKDEDSFNVMTTVTVSAQQRCAHTESPGRIIPQVPGLNAASSPLMRGGKPWSSDWSHPIMFGWRLPHSWGWSHQAVCTPRPRQWVFIYAVTEDEVMGMFGCEDGDPWVTALLTWRSRSSAFKGIWFPVKVGVHPRSLTQGLIYGGWCHQAQGCLWVF